jgi:iron-sulfur cluster assembly protein
MSIMMIVRAIIAFLLTASVLNVATAWITPAVSRTVSLASVSSSVPGRYSTLPIFQSTETGTEVEVIEAYDYDVPEDAVVMIKPNAMRRLRELRDQQKLADGECLVLRMGVRSGGCSGMSYVMDFAKAADIQEDDQVDEYMSDRIQCVVDSKSMLYLYGLELDYSNELIGGGFQFFNPNAEESCGCGSSFGV